MIGFEDYYQKVTGNKPRKWQSQLVKLILNNKWHDVLYAKTGYGKMSIVEIWYYCLLWQMLAGERNVPIRLHYIINRRTIVDDVWEKSKKLQKVIQGIFSDELKHLKLIDHKGLEIIRLRGGLGKKELVNTHSPSFPAIYISTLDQYGSRLMFRGYGMSTKMRSFHAGLCLYDSLIVVDESHTAQTMTNLVNDIKNIQKNKLPGVIEPRVLEMTATPSSDKDVFNLDFSDLAHLDKQKPIKIHKSTSKLAEIVSLAKAESLNNKCVLVVVNTVTLARKVFSILRKSSSAQVSLLTGQNRPIRIASKDMEILQEYLKDRNNLREGNKIVVATQTIEVGVDYNADVMISELASLEAIIQRAGRLNRFGDMEHGKAVFHIVYDKDNLKDDPIYGEDSSKCLTFLQSLGKTNSFPLPKASKEYHSEPDKKLILTSEDMNRLTVTTPDLPFDIDPYIKGINHSAEVMIVYRDWLNLNSIHDPATIETIKQVGTKPAEIMRIPISALLYKSSFDADVDHKEKEDKKKDKSRFYGKSVIVRRFGKYLSTSITSDKIKPNDLIFMPCSYGGLDKWGWNQEEKGVYCGDVFNSCTGKKFYPPDVPPSKNLKSGWAEELTENGGILRREISRYYGSRNKTKDANGFPFGTTLQDHTNLVVYYCNKFLKELGLSHLEKDFNEAALFHDLGKSDIRFQRFMCKWPFDILLGKPPKQNEMGTFVDPLGWRHEFASLAILAASKKIISPLTYHLIGSHHGYFRPYVREVLDNKKTQPEKIILNGEVFIYDKPFDEFINKSFDELNKKYGIWGLAFLESIFRLADHAASAHQGDMPKWKK